MTEKIQNPVLSGFYPDPSICRVDDNFYLVTSTFAYFPGIPVFQSRDLFNWKQIGNAIDRPGQLCYEGHRISQGLFAPTIRYNNGTFYILCTLIHTGGNFIITSKNPQGPYSDPVWLEGADGIDPSIFFDDDGKVYYTGTHPAPEGEAYSGDYEIYIREMDLQLLNEGKNPLTGDNTGIWRTALRNAIWPEGPHIYKIGNWYYLIYAEGGTGLDHAVCAARAKNIRGPWEGKKSNPILTHRHLGKNTEIINTGHADLFDDPNGNWWMVLLASRPFEGVCPLGRETFLVPVFWENDWPFIGTKSGLIEKEIDAVCVTRKSQDSRADVFAPEPVCDHFNEKLPLNWLSIRMPVKKEDAAFSLTERKDALRLFTIKDTMRTKGHPSFAGRRIRHKNWAFSASIEFAPNTENESAGIVLFQNEDWHYRLELGMKNVVNYILKLIKVSGKDNEELIKSAEIKLKGAHAVLAAICKEMKLSFFYGNDQYSLELFADSQDAKILSTEYAGGFVGSLAGVFASGNGSDTKNHADVFWAEYRSLE
ncbi:MAG: glycoside hydrolase family 43 protein [Treponema sp.]|nr:glycoside hydrolase family 43 protein [Treponema sp.]